MKVVSIENIKFLSLDENEFLSIFDKNGLFVFPAAPALANIFRDKEYKISLENSDYVFFDSGFLCLYLSIFKSIKVKKLSGLLFLRKLFLKLNNEKKSIFLVDPNQYHSNTNINYLKKIGQKKLESYIAPIYKDKIIDEKLISKINEFKPEYVIINLGGGVQEKLGLYLKRNLNHETKIICTGAAIAFLTGLQANIPNIVDKIYMGWLWRIFSNPKLFLARYLYAFKLLPILLKSKIDVIK
jgi:UDP-N-acetyl-D-mannosaminuronic acid transferase (WecB/TagA/CpsF family)